MKALIRKETHGLEKKKGKLVLIRLTFTEAVDYIVLLNLKIKPIVEPSDLNGEGETFVVLLAK